MSDRQFPADLDRATLVSIFYQTIFAPKSWIGLPEEPVSGSRTLQSEGPILFKKEDLDLLRPLFEQALNFHEKRTIVEAQDRMNSAALQGLPLPMVIVNKSCEIVSATEAAEKTLSEGDFLVRHGQGLASVSKSFARKLSSAVRHTIETGTTSVLTESLRPDDVRMVLATPLPTWEVSEGEEMAALFFNYSFRDVRDFSPILAEAHGLTPAEADVVALLVQGLSLEDIAQVKNSSINTVRTQIKQVYSKTDTSRQGELIARVMSGPGLWMRMLKTQEPSAHEGGEEDTFTEVVLPLKSGGRIGYGDYGPQNGYPVFLINHFFGLRRERRADEAMLSELGLRLIIPQRPGVGLSSRQDNMSLESWANDVIELADHLDIAKFGVIGVSAGGPYGMAISAFHPQRVSLLGLIATVVPFDEMPDIPQTNLPRRLLTSMARHWPGAAKGLLKIRLKEMYETPEVAIRDLAERGSPADRELLKDQVLREICLRNLKEAGAISRDVLAEEAIMLSRPWGFSAADIKAPTLLWHGEQDHYGASDEVRALAALIPDSNLQLGKDWGHYFFYKVRRDLLQDFSNALGEAATGSGR